MRLIRHAQEGVRNLFFSKLRSLLALLGVLVGTASVVAMVLGGDLATNEALKQFKSLGTDLLALTINATEENQSTGEKNENLSLDQVLQLSQADPAILQIAPYTQLFPTIVYNGTPITGTMLGVTDSFASSVHIRLQQGRFISLLDKYELFCVVGKKIYEQMQKIARRNPIGDQIQIGKNIFTVIGVAKEWPENGFVYTNVDNAVMVPILTSTVMSEYATINNIILRLTPNANIQQVEDNVTARVHQLLPNKDVNYRSAKELIAKMQKQSNILSVFLGLIGGISLLVGGIGVMNIMLVSVMERRREIGIRLAVGATRKDIGLLFLLESVMLSLMGGTLGVIIGMVIAYGMACIWHWEFILFWWPLLAGFSVSVAVGIFFGFYPAYLASRLDPIAALRAE